MCVLNMQYRETGQKHKKSYLEGIEDVFLQRTKRNLLTSTTELDLFMLPK